MWSAASDCTDGDTTDYICHQRLHRRWTQLITSVTSKHNWLHLSPATVQTVNTTDYICHQRLCGQWTQLITSVTSDCTVNTTDYICHQQLHRQWTQLITSVISDCTDSEHNWLHVTSDCTDDEHNWLHLSPATVQMMNTADYICHQRLYRWWTQLITSVSSDCSGSEHKWLHPSPVTTTVQTINTNDYMSSVTVQWTQMITSITSDNKQKTNDYLSPVTVQTVNIITPVTRLYRQWTLIITSPFWDSIQTMNINNYISIQRPQGEVCLTVMYKREVFVLILHVWRLFCFYDKLRTQLLCTSWVLWLCPERGGFVLPSCTRWV